MSDAENASLDNLKAEINASGQFPKRLARLERDTFGVTVAFEDGPMAVGRSVDVALALASELMRGKAH